MGGCKSLMLFFGGFFFCLAGKRTRDFAFVSLCYGRSGEEICTGYAMAASGRMQYDYKQTNSAWSLTGRRDSGYIYLDWLHGNRCISGECHRFSEQFPSRMAWSGTGAPTNWLWCFTY